MPINQLFRTIPDRAFTIKGYGTVVTGTVCSGKARNGDILELLPYYKEFKICLIFCNAPSRCCFSISVYWLRRLSSPSPTPAPLNAR